MSCPTSCRYESCCKSLWLRKVRARAVKFGVNVVDIRLQRFLSLGLFVVPLLLHIKTKYQYMVSEVRSDAAGPAITG